MKNLTLNFRNFQTFYTLLFFNLFLISGCSNLKEKDEINICSSTILPCLKSNEHILLITNRGKVKLELYGKSAPITVGNFVNFVDKGSYNSSIFNRVINKPYPFIIRVGGNNITDKKNKFIESKAEKIRYIPLEIKLRTNSIPTYGKVIEAPSKLKNIELKHKRSYLSMARSKDLNSASSQFYILLKSLPELDGRFAVFGKVISGMDIVDSIKEDDYIIEAKRLDP